MLALLMKGVFSNTEPYVGTVLYSPYFSLSFWVKKISANIYNCLVLWVCLRVCHCQCYQNHSIGVAVTSELK